MSKKQNPYRNVSNLIISMLLAFLFLYVCLFTMQGCASKPFQNNFHYTGGGLHMGRSTVGPISNHVKTDEHTTTFGVNAVAGRIAGKNQKIRYGFELEASGHKFGSDNPERDEANFISTTLSLFSTYDIIHREKWQIYGGAGAGLGIMPHRHGDHPLVNKGPAIGYLDYRLGWRYYFTNSTWFPTESWVSLEYRMSHWSVPFQSDPGENDDMIFFQVTIPTKLFEKERK